MPGRVRMGEGRCPLIERSDRGSDEAFVPWKTSCGRILGGLPLGMAVSISLMLAVEDAAGSAAWYGTALGASELWSLGSVRALEIGGAPFFLHEPYGADFVSPVLHGQTTVRVEVFVDEPDLLIESAIAAGATPSIDGIVDRPAPWGTHRQGGFTDPFGHVWLVGDRSPLQRLDSDGTS